MTTGTEREALLSTLEETVRDVLAYFEGPGATSAARVGEWGPKEVLSHFLHWHQATIEGMEAVARGAAPWKATEATDEANAGAVARFRSESVGQLVARARQLQARLVQAARALPSLDTPVMLRHDGTAQTGRDRLERIPRHWREHVAELRAQEGR